MPTAVQEKEQTSTQVNPAMKWLAGWWSGMTARFRKRGWLIALVGTATLWLLNNLAGDFSVRVFGFVSAFFVKLVARPAGLLGLAFFVILVVLVIRAFWEARPSKSKTGGRLWIAEERAKLAQEGEQIARTELATTQEELRRGDTRIGDLTKSLADADTERIALFQHMHYGDRLIEPAPLKDADFAVMLSRTEEMVPNITGMVQNGERVWHHLLGKMPASASKESLEWLFTFVQEGPVPQCKRSYKFMWDLLAIRQDPRRALASFYARYCDWRLWIRRFADAIPSHLYEAPAYHDWFRNDTQFFADLQQRLSTTPFAAVRSAVRSYNESNEPVTPLPDPDRDP